MIADLPPQLILPEHYRHGRPAIIQPAQQEAMAFPFGVVLGQPKSLIDILDRNNLKTNLRIALDAGDINSVPSSSTTKWLDTSGNGYDFLRGSTSGSDTTDPTFNGTPGNLSGSEYWSSDGGDFFTYDSANETFMTDMAKSGQTVSFAAWMYIPTDASIYALSTQNSGSAQGLLWGYSGSQNTHQLLLRSSTNTDIVVATGGGDISTSFPRWTYFHFSGTHGSGNAYTLCINGTVTSGSYPAATYGTGNAASTLRLWMNTSAGGAAPNTHRFAMLGVWTGTAHTSAQMTSLFNATRTRFGV